VNWFLLVRDASLPQCRCGHERGAGHLGAKQSKVRGSVSGLLASPVRDGRHQLHIPSWRGAWVLNMLVLHI